MRKATAQLASHSTCSECSEFFVYASDHAEDCPWYEQDGPLIKQLKFEDILHKQIGDIGDHPFTPLSRKKVLLQEKREEKRLWATSNKY